MFLLSKKSFKMFAFMLLAFMFTLTNAYANSADCPSFERPGGAVEGVFVDSDDYGDYYMLNIDGNISITCQEHLVLEWFGGSKPIGRRVRIEYNEFQTYFADNDWCVQRDMCTSGVIID